MELPPLPEGSSIRVSQEGDDAVLEWPARASAWGLVLGYVFQAVLVGAALSGFFDATFMRWIAAGISLVTASLYLRIVLRDRRKATLSHYLPSLISTGVLVGSALTDGWTARGLLAAGLLSPSVYLVRSSRATGQARLRIGTGALSWTAWEGLPAMTYRREDVLGVRLVGDAPTLSVRGVSKIKTALFLSGRLHADEGAWLKRVLEGWRAGGAALSRGFDLPPFPAGAKLAAEESEGVLRIQWGVRGGEFRRKLRVLGYCGAGVLMVGAILMPYVVQSRAFSYQAFFGLGIGGLMAWLVSRRFWPEIRRLALATGHAELSLDAVGLSFDPGAGQPLLEAAQGEIVRVEAGRKPGEILLARPPKKKPLKLRAPGSAEADWVKEAVERWRTKA